LHQSRRVDIGNTFESGGQKALAAITGSGAALTAARVAANSLAGASGISRRWMFSSMKSMPVSAGKAALV
jgi:hypothetical protein